jgi:predicted metal-dependent HD superfamily phosphohydrolase
MGAMPPAFLTPDLLAELRHRHEEPHRHHHRWDRVAGMVAEAEEIAHGIGDRTAFLLALLFHTAVFDRREPGHAEASVALMRRRLPDAPAAWLARAEALILAWARQAVPETDDPSLRADAALLLDMDGAVLGAPAPEYEVYEAAIRRESPHLTEERWGDGRATALRLVLWRDRIYRTDRYFLLCERRARRNLEATLTRLEDG